MAPVWRRVPGNPWRTTRLGAVVAAPDGIAVLEGAAAVVLALLPATADELVELVGDEAAVLAALDGLAGGALVERS
jgi:hypothetical protein